MNLYLDDNRADPALVAWLQKTGHDVVCPVDVDLEGASDARHLMFAVGASRQVLTADRGDFRDLHELVLTCGGSHLGILVIRFDDDPRHNMKPKHIGAAIANLDASGLSLTNELVVLNHWR